MENNTWGGYTGDQDSCSSGVAVILCLLYSFVDWFMVFRFFAWFYQDMLNECSIFFSSTHRQINRINRCPFSTRVL